MSLPSIKTIQEELKITDLSKISKEKQEEILVEAMKRDLGPALTFLHDHLHKNSGKKWEQDPNSPLGKMWKQDPNSPLGKMLIRIHAGDVLRQMAEKHFCHGKKLMFFNCCNGLIEEPENEETKEKGKIKEKEFNPILLQLQIQNGDVPSEHC